MLLFLCVDFSVMVMSFNGIGLLFRTFLIAQLVMNHLQYRRPWFDSWVRKLRWEGIG